MKATTLLLNAGLLLLLLWLYGGDVADVVRGRTAPVSALTELPPLGFALAVLGAALAATGTVAWGLWRRRPEGFRGYRLLPIVAALALFVDLFVLSAERLPFSSTDLTTAALLRFGELAQALSHGQVETDAGRLSALLPELGAPPYLVQGQRPTTWRLEVRTGCPGPLQEAPGVPAGTLLYCVAPDRSAAWVSAVGLPAEQRFGAPAVVAQGGEVRFAFVDGRLPEAGEEAPPGALEAAPPAAGR